MTDSIPNTRSRWPHFFAVTLACATFPLIWVGGLVTTYDAGMAVPDWPTTYGYNLFLYPLSTWLSGPWDLFIEHGHRLLGSLAGLLTIAFNVAIWRYESRKWMQAVGLSALALVIFQGLLGGLRVRLDSTELARLHGCVGPLFFALCVALCVMTSRHWLPGKRPQSAIRPTTVVAAWFTFVVVYLQLILGAHLRHPGVNWSPSQFRAVVVMHVVTAVFLLLQVAGVAKTARKLPSSLKHPAWLMSALVLGQLLLGVATWRAKYGWPTFIPMTPTSSLTNFTVKAESMLQAITVTSHVAVGSLILATSTCYAVRLSRCALLAVRQAPSVATGGGVIGKPQAPISLVQGVAT